MKSSLLALALARLAHGANVTVHEVKGSLACIRTASRICPAHVATVARTLLGLSECSGAQYPLDSPVADIQWVGKEKQVRG